MASFEDITKGPTTLTAVNDEVVVAKPGMGTATFQMVIVSGTITLAFEALTQEGVSPSWQAIPAENISTGVTATTTSTAGIYRVVSAGTRRVRARATAITGSSTVTGNASTGSTAGGGAAASGSASAPVVLVGGSTGAKTSVAAAAANTLLIAFNAARLGATVVNEGISQILYLTLGSTAASATSYTKKMQPGEYYEVPFGFIGPVRGFWTGPEGTGFARCTEITA